MTEYALNIWQDFEWHADLYADGELLDSVTAEDVKDAEAIVHAMLSEYGVEVDLTTAAVMLWDLPNATQWRAVKI